MELFLATRSIHYQDQNLLNLPHSFLTQLLLISGCQLQVCFFLHEEFHHFAFFLHCLGTLSSNSPITNEDDPQLVRASMSVNVEQIMRERNDPNLSSELSNRRGSSQTLFHFPYSTLSLFVFHCRHSIGSIMKQPKISEGTSSTDDPSPTSPIKTMNPSTAALLQNMEDQPSPRGFMGGRGGRGGRGGGMQKMMSFNVASKPSRGTQLASFGKGVGVSVRGRGLEAPSSITTSGHNLFQNEIESKIDEFGVSPVKGVLSPSSNMASRDDFGNYGVMVIVSEAKAYEPSWKNRLHNLNDNIISSLASSNLLGSEKESSDNEENDMIPTNQLQSTTSLSSVLHAIDDILRLASSKLDLSFDLQQSLGDISTAVQNTKKSVKVAEGGKISEEGSAEDGSSPHVCSIIHPLVP